MPDVCTSGSREATNHQWFARSVNRLITVLPEREKMPKLINLLGKKIGSWMVLERAKNNKYGNIRWLCRCECKRKVIVLGDSLRRGVSTRCRSCASRELATTHGGTGTRLFTAWNDMRHRCSNENDIGYKDYGGRGIKVCKEWSKSFVVFRDWALANKYQHNLTIDRINNNGNYEPNNCCWSTKKQQARNRRNNHLIIINEVERTIAEWAEIAGIGRVTLLQRVNSGWCEERLLIKPMRVGCNVRG